MEADGRVQGQVDIDGEINKCEKKLALAQMSLSKIVKVEAQADYESTVPANVRLANEEKVRARANCGGLTADIFPLSQRKTLEADIKLLEHSIEMFTQMK